MSDSHIPPGWDELSKARKMLAGREARPLADLTDAELLAGYERAKRLKALRAEAESVAVPPDVAAEVAAMSDEQLLAAYRELTA